MQNLDRQNFKDQVFEELPELVLCSNFERCTFNGATKFERCNLIDCVFNKECEFDRSNIIDSKEEEKRANINFEELQ